ncbi:IS110 family transposase [Ruegeria spongiae]|uniref:IS110 family transposase n=1 Tax=Ruegeria spongiae TaxID=2942209 RepID=UPI003570CC23
MIPNMVSAIKRLLSARRKGGTSFIICKATGGYERHVLHCCVELNPSVHRAHRTRTRSFAKYLSLSAKAGAVDARMLALFDVQSEGLRRWQKLNQATVELRGLRRRHNDLAQMSGSEQTGWNIHTSKRLNDPRDA